MVPILSVRRARSRKSPSPLQWLLMLGPVLLVMGSGGVASAGSVFGRHWDYTVGPIPFSVAIGDMNCDGRPDLVVADQGDAISVLLGKGDGTYYPKTDIIGQAAPYSIALGDMNCDGKPDIVTSNTTASGISVLLGDGLGGFGPASGVSTGSYPGTLALEDLNCDGKLDVAVPNYFSGTVSILLGDGHGGFGPKNDLALGGQSPGGRDGGPEL